MTTDTVLIVDDEETVRRTFQDWLASSGLGLRVFAVGDAESALRVANEHAIDLAILDWNLGSGSDGLRLLEDLVEFRPDVVAILITGFAHVATPLEALRMGVRDYLDKNADLSRESFLKAIRNQLDRIHPAKRQRELNRSLASFRAAVENVLPLVRTAAAFNDPVPLPEAVRSLFRFLIRATGAEDGVLLVRHLANTGAETTLAFAPTGATLPVPAVPFSRSLAASVVSHQEPMLLNVTDVADGAVELMPFETGRKSILAAPLPVGSGTSVVLELFDKPAPGFTPADRQLVAAASEVGADLLRQALAERQTYRLLFDAVEAALKATTGVTEVIAPSPPETPPQAVIERLKEGLGGDPNAVADPDTTLRLVEAVRGLAVRHGSIAVEHCVRVVTDLRKLLDGITGTA
jgi:ActR/RegA family two-component response regulator